MLQKLTKEKISPEIKTLESRHTAKTVEAVSIFPNILYTYVFNLRQFLSMGSYEDFTFLKHFFNR